MKLTNLKRLLDVVGGILTAVMWLGLAYIALFHLTDAGGVIAWVD